MNKISRRSLALWTADQLEAGKPVPHIAKSIGAVLKQSGKPDQIEFLINDIVWELEQRQTLAVGKVTSAQVISQELEQALKTQLKEATNAKQVALERRVDKSVIGGIRVETASRVWDVTVARKLSDLKEVF